jgi:hypothetical protein
MVQLAMTGDLHLMQLQMALWTMAAYPDLHQMVIVGITAIQHRTAM